MANIVWSFGVALTAEDEASEPVEKLAGRVNILASSLQKLVEVQALASGSFKQFQGDLDTTSKALASIGNAGNLNTSVQSVENMRTALGGLNGSLNQSSQSFDLFGMVTRAVLTDGLSLVFEFGKVIVEDITSVISGAFSLIKNLAGVIIEDAFSVLKFGFNVIKDGALSIATLIPNTFGRVSAALSDINIKLREWAHTTNDILALGKNYYDFQSSIQRISTEFFASEDSSNRFKKSLIDLQRSLGITQASTADLVEGLAQYGIALDSLKAGGVSKGDVELLGLLAYRYGLGATAVSHLAASTKSLGLNLSELETRAAGWQNAFGITGLMQQLPEIVDTARQSLREFGRSVVGDERSLVDATVKTAAAFTRALGVDIRNATKLATDSTQRFFGIMRQDKRALLGIGEFSSLSKLMFQVGYSLQDVNTLAKAATTDQVGYANTLVGTYKKLQETNPLFAERWLELVSDELPEGIRSLVRDEKALTKANEDRFKSEQFAAGEAGKSRESFRSGLEKIANFALEKFNVITDSIYTSFGLLFADELPDILKGLSNTFINVGDSVDTFVSQLKGNKDFKEAKEILKGLVSSFIQLSTGAKIAGEGFSTLSVISSILTPINLLTGSLKTLFDLLSGRKTIIDLGKGLIGSVKNITEVSTAIKLIRDTLNDPKLSTASKFTTSLGHAFRGLFNFLDRSFEGLPSKVVSALSAVGSAIESKVTEFNKYFEDNRTSILESVNSTASSIGNMLGSIAKGALDFVRGLLDGKNLEDSWNSITTSFNSQLSEAGPLIQSLITFAKNVKDIASTALNGFLNGFLAPFETNTEKVWSNLKSGLLDFKSVMLDVYEVSLSVIKGILDVSLAVARGFFGLKGTFKEFVSYAVEIIKSPLEILASIPGVGDKFKGVVQEIYNRQIGLRIEANEDAKFAEKIGGIQERVAGFNPIDVSKQRANIALDRESLKAPGAELRSAVEKPAAPPPPAATRVSAEAPLSAPMSKVELGAEAMDILVKAMKAQVDSMKVQITVEDSAKLMGFVARQLNRRASE